MQRLIWLLSCVILFSCHDNFPGYSFKADDVHYQLIRFGSGDRQVCGSFEATLRVSLCRFYEGSEDYWSEYGFQNLAADFANNAAFCALICEASSGDSLSLIFPYSVIKGTLLDEYEVDGWQLADTSKIRLDVGVGEIRTQEEVNKALEEKMRAGILRENEFLQEFMSNSKLLESYQKLDDVFFKKILETSGERLTYGQDIEFNYSGYFLDGTEFDNSVLGQSTMWFNMGKPDQVIRGIELVLPHLNDGEKARVYVPSHLGFGQGGSATGVVPPLTPVYFDISARIFVNDSLVTDSISLP
jgi:FKBP-type peptidyl-prolyl cis-trans isomerase